MNQEIEIWNVLHDGIISIFSEVNESTLTVFVHIPYIRRKIEPAGVSFVLKLFGVKTCIAQDFDGNEESISENYDANRPEILNTESKSMPVILHTSIGNLVLEYEGIKYFLDTGTEIEYETILNACTEYWNEWRNKNQA
ncbi:MAG: hypothetical protein EOO07_35610 [Chitinophagaceae bacterium]|nr:MAG: hypothetical protein EOO07_35610 [Chitinophagaceae bacterium]